VFIIAPALLVITVIMPFAVIRFSPSIVVADLNIGLLFFLAMTALGIYGIVLGGWSSNYKYALLGAVRASAQMLSYEVFMGLSLMGVVLMSGSFNLGEIVNAQKGMWYCIPQFPGLVLFTIAGFAESHRIPFDLPEAEAELIAGYHTEYSGMKFGMYFLGEYLGITMTSAMIVTLFFGGWLGPFLPPVVWVLIKTFLCICVFILVRATLPRPRYDQLMGLAWKILLPLSLANLMITGAVVLALN
jgi:NADH-quinone oxidoreductase subunit H